MSHRIGADLIGLGVISSGMVNGLLETRRRSWWPAHMIKDGAILHNLT